MAKKTRKTKPPARQRCAQCGYYKDVCRCRPLPTFEMIISRGSPGCADQLQPLKGVIRFGTVDWYIEMSHRGDQLLLRGSHTLQLEPDGSNTVLVHTTADAEARVFAAAQRLLDVEKENKKFWRKKGKQPEKR